jgi:polysaccharide export outer membrane protein
MKKIIFYWGTIALSIFLISPTFAYAQPGKEDLLKKQAQAEIMADSDRYVIGPEDVLYIHVWREETLTRTVIVRMDGKISIPLIDDIQAAGLTPLQLKEVLIQKFKKFVESPTASVIVMEANSFKVYISGYVRAPGVYKLRNETSIAQIISMAGGLTEWANPKKITILRKENGKEKQIIVNYRKIMQGKELDSNLILKAGDTIYVP